MSAADSMAAWRTALRGIAPDLIEALGGTLGKLAAFLGSFPLPTAGAAGAPQGYAGLDRRGPYERLLASEWALLRSAPLEFQRRAIAGEHLFFALARQEPVGSRRCVVLADAGPLQLGNARLAQLALLFVLAERAQAARVDFLWSSWQATPGELAAGFDAPGVSRFLAQRAHREVSGSDAAAWLAALGPPAAGEERWALGGDGLLQPSPHGAAFQRVVIREVDAVRCERLALAWQPPGRPRRSLELELPSEVERMRLLRNPFLVMPPPAAKARPAARMQLPGPIAGAFFVGGSERLVVRVADQLWFFHLPPRIDKSYGVTRLFETLPGEVLVAAGGRGSQLAVVLVRGSELVFHRIARRLIREHQPQVRPNLGGVIPHGSGRSCGLCLFEPDATGGCWYFVDGAARVHRLRAAGADPGEPTGPLLEACQGLFPIGTGVFGLTPAESVLLKGRKLQQASGPSEKLQPEAFAGWGGKEFCLTAYQVADGFRVGRRTLRPGPGRVVGVIGEQQKQDEGLVLIENDGRTLVHVSLRTSRVLVRAESEIVGVAVAADRPLIAYWTRGRCLEVIDFRTAETATICAEEP